MCVLLISYWFNLKKQQKKAQLVKRRNAIQNKKGKNSTKVRGISMLKICDKKFYNEVYKKYYSVSFSVHFSYLGKHFSTTYRIKKNGSNLKSRWKEAVDFLCKAKKIRSNQAFYLRQPTLAEFKKVRQTK